MERLIGLFIVIHLLSGCGERQSQKDKLQGFWLVENVVVGDQQMTPIGKWTRIHTDGTFESGNGWLKSSEGTWEWNAEDRTFLPQETAGLQMTDPFGAFTVAFEGENMIWVRNEGGDTVRVTLSRINELPMAPADRLQGVWSLAGVTKGGEPVDVAGKHKGMHIRWDRIYVEFSEDGNRRTGYWHMNAHRPDITLLSHDPEQPAESWTVETEGNQILILTGISDSNRDRVRTYQRIHQYPTGPE